MNNPTPSNTSPTNNLEMTPPPVLKIAQSLSHKPAQEKESNDYIPQILANEQEVMGYHDFKLNETNTMAEEENKREVLNESYSKNEEINQINDDKPKFSSKKQAIKLITVPQENESFANPNKESSNPQEYESSTLEMKAQNLDISEIKQQPPELNDSKYDSPCLSPNSVFSLKNRIKCVFFLNRNSRFPEKSRF